MKFKHPEDEADFLKFGHIKIWWILRILDYSAKLLGAAKISHYGSELFEVLVTSARRPAGEKPSYHPKGQAVDIRTKERPAEFVEVIKELLRLLHGIDPKITWLHESIGQENEHIHIQYREGEPAVLKKPI